MEIKILVRTFLLGPFFCAMIFFLISVAASYFSGTDNTADVQALLMIFGMLVFAAYSMVIFPAFGFLPGIFPLTLYSLMLAFAAPPLFDFLTRRKLTTEVKLLALTFLSTLLGLLIYGGFLFLATLSGSSLGLGFSLKVVIPTSALFGAWTGITCARTEGN